MTHEGFALVPAPRGDSFVELSRSKQGRVFRKQILKYGDLLYPGIAGGKVVIDEAFADRMIANFKAGVSDIVQTPLVDEDNKHSEDPLRNTGEVINIVKASNGVYVDIDARKHVDDFGVTLLGASAFFNLNETDRATGKKVGPTLHHVAITNRPYVTNLDGFQELIAASANGFDTNTQNVVVLSAADDLEGDVKMPLDELIAELKAEHGIDVLALQLSAESLDSALKLSASIQEQLLGTGFLKLSAGADADSAAIISAVSEIVESNVKLSAELDETRETAAKAAAEAEVDALILSARVLPANKDAMIELRLSNEDLFKRLVPETPVIKLSAEAGSSDPDEETDKTTVEDEVARLSALAAQTTGVNVRA